MNPKKLIVFCAYRTWALEIYNKAKKELGKDFETELFTSEEEFNRQIEKINPDIIFFVGWSWIIPEPVVSKFRCVCLHPSPLPKYRGGSPIQHQIINGEKNSAVTLFIMDKFVDKGPIVFQEQFPLDGELEDVFSQIISKGEKGIVEVARRCLKTGKLEGIPQTTQATYFKRRTPEQSEIKISDFANCTAKEIYNKIRALQDPYPNAFVVCKGGAKLYIIKARAEERADEK